MGSSREMRLGVFIGDNGAGGEAIVTVAKVGREYRIRYAGKDHLCHPSVRGIDTAKREALLVFGVRNAVFVSA